MNFLKFEDEKITAKGEQRAWVTLDQLRTLWFNTGTQCNLSCENCYIESNPTNDRLVYLTSDDVAPYLDEAKDLELIGLTGGEPFLNPNIISILNLILQKGFDVLVLTNAYRVIKRHEMALLDLKEKFGNKLHLRISLDHYTKKMHEEQRGVNTFDKTLERFKWLWDSGFNLSLAARSLISEENVVQKYQDLLDSRNIGLKLSSDKIVVFPEMIASEDVPEITTACWDILKKSPSDQMCASERMIVKRKGADRSVVLPCTLLAYDEKFELGHTLKDSKKDVYLNHAFCAKFCVLGGASCSSAK